MNFYLKLFSAHAQNNVAVVARVYRIIPACCGEGGPVTCDVCECAYRDIGTKMDVESYVNTPLENRIICSDVPETCQFEGCCLGIDEAGRGPVLGKPKMLFKDDSRFLYYTYLVIIYRSNGVWLCLLSQK